MSNKKIGNEFEERMSRLLYDNGYWVHRLSANEAGQPADLIAVRKRTAYLIDCKVCENGYFDTRRIEDNQDSAMNLWRECLNGEAWFALLVEGQIYMATHNHLRKIKGRISGEFIKDNCRTFEDWLGEG